MCLKLMSFIPIHFHDLIRFNTKGSFKCLHLEFFIPRLGNHDGSHGLYLCTAQTSTSDDHEDILMTVGTYGHVPAKFHYHTCS